MHQDGFTLIELVIVVLLLGLITSLSLPLVSSYEPDRLASSARRLAGAVKYLYNEAAMTGLEHRLVFNLEEGSYQGDRLNRSGEWVALNGSGGAHHLAEEIRYKRIYQPGNGEQSDGEVVTLMSPGGWLQETFIQLEDTHKNRLNLRLAPLTGTTEILDDWQGPP